MSWMFIDHKATKHKELGLTTHHKMTPRSKSCPLLPNEPILSQTALGLYDAIMGHENEGYFESNASWSTTDHHISTLLYSLNLLSERVQQTKSLVSQLAISFSSDQHSDFQVDPTSMIRVTGLVQEIVSVSSSMMFTCQQMSLSLDSNLVNGNPKDMPSIFQHDIDQLMASSADIDRERNNHVIISHDVSQEREHDEIAGSCKFGSSDDQSISRWFDRGEEYMNVNLSCDNTKTTTNTDQTGYYEMIIEMDAADLLAMYTHFCQVCNKGFKRDANLRMHMRAHGDEYKSTAALANPKKNNLDNMVESMSSKLQMAKRYSCPQDGCRWNRKHPKFQPLKSMICVKNHYKRSHCPKMYVCKRCNQKEFSVVSDLRTHEKHCGYSKWRCSCGTTFSRKDKLLGHVRLFVGHFPMDQNHGFDDS